MIDESVETLQRARELLTAGRNEEAMALLEALEELWRSEQTVTTTEAARLLGIRSINTLKALLKVEGIETVANGNRIMIPIDEVLRLKNSRRTQGIRASDEAHDASFDDDTSMTEADMDILHDSRPGRLPWQRG